MHMLWCEKSCTASCDLHMMWCQKSCRVYSLSYDLVSIILLWCGKSCEASSGKQHVLWYQKSCLLSLYDLFMKQDMLWCQKSCCQNRWWLLLQYMLQYTVKTPQFHIPTWKNSSACGVWEDIQSSLAQCSIDTEDTEEWEE